MKKFFVSSLIATVVLMQSAKADLWGPLPGIAETIGNVLIGTTTVTPTYGIYTWDFYTETVVSNPSAPSLTSSRMKVRYDPIFKTVGFEDHTTTLTSDVTTTSQFLIGQIFLSNFSCYASNYMNISAETYTMFVMCSQSSSGLIKPSGPFDIHFMTMGTAQPASCTSPTNSYGFTRRFGQTVSAQPFGFVTTQVGTPNYQILYPMQCWAGGDDYDY